MGVLQAGTGPLWARAGSAHGVAPPGWWALLAKSPQVSARLGASTHAETRMWPRTELFPTQAATVSP